MPKLKNGMDICFCGHVKHKHRYGSAYCRVTGCGCQDFISVVDYNLTKIYAQVFLYIIWMITIVMMVTLFNMLNIYVPGIFFLTFLSSSMYFLLILTAIYIFSALQELAILYKKVKSWEVLDE